MLVLETKACKGIPAYLWSSFSNIPHISFLPLEAENIKNALSFLQLNQCLSPSSSGTNTSLQDLCSHINKYKHPHAHRLHDIVLRFCCSFFFFFIVVFNNSRIHFSPHWRHVYSAFRAAVSVVKAIKDCKRIIYRNQIFNHIQPHS